MLGCKLSLQVLSGGELAQEGGRSAVNTGLLGNYGSQSELELSWLGRVYRATLARLCLVSSWEKAQRLSVLPRSLLAGSFGGVACAVLCPPGGGIDRMSTRFLGFPSPVTLMDPLNPDVWQLVS